jgi:hypothetical protein
MAKTFNHAVQAAFYVGGAEIAEQLAVFCSIKKLGWSPDVKVAMVKLPASNIEDAAYMLLKGQQTSVLQNILVDLLTPIKEHNLFDLSDWLRDLDSVPDYMKEYWTANRIPSVLDDLMKKAIANGAGGPGAVLGDTWPLPPKTHTKTAAIPQATKADTKPVGKRTLKGTLKFDTKFSGKPLKGPAGRGKVSKETYKKAEPKVIEEAPKGIKELISDARQALGDKKMIQLSSKAVWTRVHKAVEAMLNANGMAYRAARPQRFETEDAQQALVVYYIKSVNDGDTDWHDFKADFLTEFDGLIAGMEAVNDEEPPRSFKVWYQHA